VIVVRRADLGDAGDIALTVAMTDMYARDPMGGGVALTENVKAKLAQMLSSHPGAVVFLASLDGRTVGVANCFYGMSSFTGSPVLNIHDLAVHPDVRGHGAGRRLIEAVEAHARQTGCSRVTLEVGAFNETALGVYKRCGFHGVGPDAESVTYFCTKHLD